MQNIDCDEITLQNLKIAGLTRNPIDANTVTGTGNITASDTITINGTVVTFASSTTDDIDDLVTLINSANITNVNAFNRSGKLRLTEELGNGLTIAGTGTILTVLGLTAQTYTKTADTALDVDTNVNIDGTLVVDGATTIGGATTVNSTLNVTGLTTLDALTTTLQLFQT